MLANEELGRLLSSVSISEIAVKTGIGKLDIPEERLLRLIEDLQLTILPYTERHARKLYELPLHHREPFARMLIGVALAESLPIVTSDRQFEQYKDVGLEVIRA